MAVTGAAKRKLSEKWKKVYRNLWRIEKLNPSVTFPILYIKDDKYGLKSTRFKFIYPEKLERTVIYEESGRDSMVYTSVIKGTKTKSAADRAEAFILNKYEKLIRDGWCETPGETEDTTKSSILRPMLFHKYMDHKDKVKFPCIVQPKFDGVRAIWHGEEQVLISRGGSEINLPHLKESLSRSSNALDGEICYRNIRLLQEVVEGISAKDKDLVFFAFDCGIDNIIGEGRFSYMERLKLLMGYLRIFEDSNVLVAPTKVCTSEIEVHDYYIKCTSDGYEGVMVKNLDSQYEFGKRTYGQLKYKVEFEHPMEIVDVVFDTSPDGEKMASFMVKHSGVTFKCTPAWSHEDRVHFAKLVASPIIHEGLRGIQVRVEYRGLSKERVPIHAVIKTERGEVIKLLDDKIKRIMSKIE